jgi:hypothetical protein
VVEASDPLLRLPVAAAVLDPGGGARMFVESHVAVFAWLRPHPGHTPPDGGQDAQGRQPLVDRCTGWSEPRAATRAARGRAGPRPGRARAARDPPPGLACAAP